MDADQHPPHLDQQVLDVYASREGGWWNPDHGDVEIPHGWELLPSGDAYLTRTVKQLGQHWLAWQPRTRNRRHRRSLGVWAPADSIAQARQMAAQTAQRRAAQRSRAAERRDAQEADYQRELAAVIVAYLDFADEHAELARQIADDAAATASQVGSGRVGRTRTLTIEERAQLAVRAHLRHRYTDYDERLFDTQADAETLDLDPATYRTIRNDADAAVDDFIDQHRSS